MADSAQNYGGKDPRQIVKDAQERFTHALDVDRKNRDAALEDLKFRAWEQWDETALRERKDRPTLTVNRIPQYINQVTGEIRKNRPGITTMPGDGSADPKTSDVFEGIIRAIERQSNAQAVYSRAAEHAATCGMGHFRLALE